MALDYYELQPDGIYRLTKHYTPGRAGQKIRFITRHHLMFIGEGEDVVDRIWNLRPASAHHVIGPRGRWVQAVYDRDTAWANANQLANQQTIAIEHSNNTGRHGGNDFHALSWNISDETIISGARVGAAYCRSEKLGIPQYGKNIRDHNEFTSTGCPVHLQGPRPGNAWGGKAGKYHHPWMEEATSFYNDLSKGLVNPDGTPIKHGFTPPKKEEEGLFMALPKARQEDLANKIDDIHHELTHRFDSRYDLRCLKAGEITESQVFDETLVGYVLEDDAKLEDVHANKLPEILTAIGELKQDVAEIKRGQEVKPDDE